VVHGLSEVEGALAALPSSGDAMKALRTAWRRLIGLRFDDLAPVVLHDYLDQVQADLGAIHEAIRKQYFDLYHEAPAPVAAVEE
jgi:uncharacterized alpha-E superfamily protein